MPDKINILTFDIEEWYIYQLYPKGGPDYYLPILENLLDEILDLLDVSNVKATFFCLGIIAREYPDVILKIASRGHEIGSHSDKHILLNKLGPMDFEEDLVRSIVALENLLKTKITTYRAPLFSINEDTLWAFEILAKYGIECDCSIFPAIRRKGGYNDFKSFYPVKIHTKEGTLIELPLNVKSVIGRKIPFSGGGYFRLLPYNTIKRMMSSSNYTISYFHLRDFDTKQKIVYSPSYFRSYYGINKMMIKFKQFLKEFDFMPVKDAVEIFKNELLDEIKI